ncbi:hypothetical protein MOQ_002888 [Trypanosoma cruzi marinkellei]|uniref:Uncharacterized protein n=1 Tax=Trypanosoma cruzi marinkellei TaxID=85056 RepID=K2N1C2_TRYCR|nr:hypothetical protein MOQ_002888 [Trypanosoma cruzi marinkellei]
MFAEVEFENEDGGVLSSAEKNGSCDSPDKSRDDMTVGVVRMHRPGETGFSCVAGTADDVESIHDARLMNGDSWLGNECHCVRCETVRVSTQLAKLRQRSSKKAMVVVLLDLDNYGFNQFRSVPTTVPANGGFDLIEHIYVWCFFGSCFSRYHGEFPSAESVCRRIPRAATDPKCKQSVGRRPSVWQRLVSEGRCHFTPCGGQRQGADNVILQIAWTMTHMPVIVLSGDREMLQKVGVNRRLVGKKAKREVAECDSLGTVDIINVLEHGKRFLPVWRELESKVRCVACN